MRIRLERSGGIAGIEIGDSIEVDELPEGLRARVLEALTPARLTAASPGGSAPRAPGAADLYQYEVSTPEGSWTVDDGGPDVELLRALEDLVSEIIRRRRAE